MRFEPLHSPEDLDSTFNRGTGFVIAVGSAAVLCYITFPLIMLALKLIGL